MEDRYLTPQQEAIRDELLIVGQDIPPLDGSIAPRLRANASSKLSALTTGLRPGHRIWVSKHRLRYLFECEGQLRARDSVGWTGWNVANVRGKVTHRAMESLIISSYRRTPLDLAQAAIDHLAETDDDLGSFVAGISDGHRQDLVRDANNALVRFIEDWPPIGDTWAPTVEARSRVSFGPVTFDAVVDLALRIPFTSGTRTFIVDFKTGMTDAGHHHDVRFYALVETLRTRVPPYRVATYYLDTGEYQCEDVDEEVLAVAAERTIEGVERIIRLETGGEPSLEAGTYCRYCSALSTCRPGQEWTAVLGGHRPRLPLIREG